MAAVSSRRARRGLFFGWWVGLVGCALCAAAAASACAADNEAIVVPSAEGGAKEASATDTSPAPICPSTDPIVADTLVWKSPSAPQADACKDADIAAMKDFLTANPKASNEDFETFVKNRSPDCHDCVFGDADGKTWPPAPVRAGKVVTFNVGACYAIVTGNDGCGKAVQNAWDCEFQACALCLAPTELAGCRSRARMGVCVTYEHLSNTACPDTSANGVCGSPFDSIRVQCVTAAKPVGDGGTDAAADADAN
jgi:hypothetical protein